MPQNMFTTVIIHQLSQPWCLTFASDYFLQTTPGREFFTMGTLSLESGVFQRILKSIIIILWERSFEGVSNSFCLFQLLPGPWCSPSLHAVGIHGYYGVGERLNRNRASLNITKLWIHAPRLLQVFGYIFELWKCLFCPFISSFIISFVEERILEVSHSSIFSDIILL